MSQGDCYKANFDEMFNNPDTYNSDEWRLVHAMRENIKGSEWWGGHCFLLNTEENLVFDFSNGARMRNDGKELVNTAQKNVLCFLATTWQLRRKMTELSAGSAGRVVCQNSPRLHYWLNFSLLLAP